MIYARVPSRLDDGFPGPIAEPATGSAAMGEPTSALDVQAVIRAPLEQYPPSVHQVALLAEAGLSVAVIDTWHLQLQEIRFPSRVQRIHVGPHTLLFMERLPISKV
jgi:hypothetical protein